MMDGGGWVSSGGWYYTSEQRSEWLRGLDDHDPVMNGELPSSNRVLWWHMRNYAHHWQYVEFVKMAIKRGVLSHYEYIVRNIIPPFAKRIPIGIDDRVLNGTRVFAESDSVILDVLLRNGLVITVGGTYYQPPTSIIASRDGNLIIEKPNGVSSVNNGLLDLLQGYRQGEYLHIAHRNDYLATSNYTNLILDYLTRKITHREGTK